MVKNRFCFSLLFAAALITGCGLHATGLGNINPDTRTFIDAPLTETEWQARRPIAITVHANFEVSRILVDIVKEPSDPSFHETLETSIETIYPLLYQSNMYWSPPAAGRYRLMAYSFTGSRINPWESWTTHTIYLNINDDHGGGSEATPAPLPTIEAGVTVLPPWIDLWADQYTLTSGSCTTLRWDSQRVDQLLLDGDAVAFSGSREVCPATTTTYTLRGTSSAGSVDYPITINISASTVPIEPSIPDAPVPAPLDTSGPTLGGMDLSVAKVFDNPACGPASITIAVNAQDSSGIARVELHYRARTESTTGAWRYKNMTALGSGNYTVELGIPEFSSSLSAFSPGRVDFLVRAWDNAGNMSEGVQMSIETAYCLF